MQTVKERRRVDVKVEIWLHSFLITVLHAFSVRLYVQAVKFVANAEVLRDGLHPLGKKQHFSYQVSNQGPSDTATRCLVSIRTTVCLLLTIFITES
jgi:hypothetical protein